jgi:hypothetical protein
MALGEEKRMSDQTPPQEPQDAQEGLPQELPSVADVLLSSVHLLITLAADAIARRERLEEAKLAIDALSSLMPQIEAVIPKEAMSGYRQALNDLQLANADALAGPPSPGPGGEPEAATQDEERPRIWTPGGDV